MNVKELCLGALTAGDASGYDLKKFFETTFSQFCRASYGSIYPALAELTAEGLVSCQGHCRQGKPERKLYHLTAAGRKVFLHALQAAAPVHRVKSDFLLALYFSHLLPPAHLQSLIEARIAELDRHIRVITQSEISQQAKNRHAAGSQFVRDYGKTVMGAARDYLRTHRQALISSADPVQPRPMKSVHRHAAKHADSQQY